MKKKCYVFSEWWIMTTALGSLLGFVIVCGSVCFKTLHDHNQFLESKIVELQENEKILVLSQEQNRKVIQELIDS